MNSLVPLNWTPTKVIRRLLAHAGSARVEGLYCGAAQGRRISGVREGCRLYRLSSDT